MLQPSVFAEGEVGAGKRNEAAGDAPLGPSSPGRLLITQLHGPVGQGVPRENKMFLFSEMKPHKINLPRVTVFLRLAARWETSGQSFAMWLSQQMAACKCPARALQ